MSSAHHIESEQVLVLKVSELGKTYQIFSSPRNRLKQVTLDWLASLGVLRHARKLYREKKALRNISFELKRGEALGVIGKNGAGKSTLLALIAGTLQPTEGQVELRGTVTSLLELGTGFAPDLTGRANIVVAGQINGHSQTLLASLMDEIIAFADIGEYVDQPVRTYSSGMMMRLAFAVQTAVKPDLLIVDEAMAVGDLDFQAKCMLRMKEMQSAGAAILFVSHSPSSVVDVCTQALLIHEGRQLTMGAPDEVIEAYHNLLQAQRSAITDHDVRGHNTESENKPPRNLVTKISPSELDGLPDFEKNALYGRAGSNPKTIRNVLISGNSSAHQSSFKFGERATCSIFIFPEEALPYLNVVYRIKTINGTPLIYGDTQLYDAYKFSFEGRCMYRVDFKFGLTLVHGSYVLSASVSMPTPKFGNDRLWEQIDYIPVCRTFQVEPRSKGMVDETVVWDNDVTICEVAPRTQAELAE